MNSNVQTHQPIRIPNCADRVTRVASSLLVMLSMAWGAGCSSDGGDGGAAPAVPSGSDNGTLDVTVRDAFGQPVSGAQVVVGQHTGTPRSSPPASHTDAAGKALIRGVPAGRFAVSARAVSAFGSAFGSREGNLSRGQSLSIDITAHPDSADAGGVVRGWVPEGGLSADGRTLEFKLQVSNVPGRTTVASDWLDEDGYSWAGDLRIASCEPSGINDVAVIRPDCILGPDGFDASYAPASGVGAGALGLDRVGPPAPYGSEGPLSAPFRTILLVDQGDRVASGDPGDQRLLAARYFLNYAGEGFFAAVLGAYAADDRPATFRLALLPQTPVALFPLETPAFTIDGRGYFETLDRLHTMEGGTSPLFAAIDRAIDLHETAGGTGPRSVVVITDGNDETCGTPASCKAARDAVVQKSRDTGVAIITVGFATISEDSFMGNRGWYAADHVTLRLLAQGAPGSAAFWAGSPDGLAPTLRTVRKYLAQMKETAVVTFRIESPTAGAFASGRTVLGQVTYGGGCYIYCEQEEPGTMIPFAVTIP